MSIRDTCTDSGRMGSAAQNRADYATGMDMGPTTLAEQNALGGYNKTDRPAGGTPPVQELTHGSRGVGSD